MEYKRYLITEKAGPWVAGTRNNGVGSELRLTEQQAEHELRLGTIQEARTKPAPKPVQESKPEAEASAESAAESVEDSAGEEKSSGKVKLRPRKRSTKSKE